MYIYIYYIYIYIYIYILERHCAHKCDITYYVDYEYSGKMNGGKQLINGG